MELRVLGAIELRVLGESRTLGPTLRLLLAALLAHRGEVVSVDLLSQALWGDAPPATARATLQTHLSKLRRAMGDEAGAVLVNRPPGYLIEAPTDAVDADRFAAAVRAAAPLLDGAPGDAAALLDEALALWNGAAFAEFADADWARPEAVRLEELRLAAVELRNDALLAGPEPGALIGELEGLVSDHPLRERFWMQLMTALHRSGRQAEALRVAQELRHLLGEELGLEPSGAFRALEQAIAIDDGLSPATADRGTGAGPGSHGRATSAGLPGLATELVGRADELAQLAEAMTTARLLTLTGPGGVGKSTLASALVRRAAGDFRDGVRFVELAAVQDDGAVRSAVGQALDVERRAERSLVESITEALGARQLLLVLDNCEHVIPAVGELATAIVRWCPEVRLLATSREPIGIAGERVQPVAPLAVPTSTDEPLASLLATPAVQVFVARAQEAAPAFEISERSAPAVAQICMQLDGLPLALELAAARMASMSPRQLADRLHERFALLGGAPGRGVRHQGLLDLVEWSYDLLSDKERTLLARLSVFAGGFDLEAAERVCGVGDLARPEVAHLLAALVDKSLVVADRSDDPVRFVQLETLRQFGAERLHDQPGADLVRSAHLHTFVELAELAAAALDGADEGLWGDRLERAVGNLRVALHAAIAAGDADDALRLVASTRELAFRRIRYELVDWAEAATSVEGAAEHPLHPTVLAVVGYGHFVRGELGQAIELAERALAARERLGVTPCGMPERVLGNALFYRGDRREALAWMDRMVAATRAAGADGRLAHALYMRSVAQTSVGDPDGGRALADDAAEAAARSGSPTAMAQADYAVGLATAGVDVGAAIDRLDRAAVMADAVGNRWLRAFAMTEALWLRAGRGETTTALRGYRQVVQTWFRGGDWANQWLSLRHLAGIFAGLGLDEEAALLFGAVAKAGASNALPFSPEGADELDEVVEALGRRLGPEAMAEASRRGAMMRDDATVAAALEVIDRVS